MHHWHNQLNVAHPFAANLFLRNLYSTAVTNDPFIADALVLTAVTLVVLHRPEDAFAEQAISFRLIRTVVDRLRLEHFTIRALQDLIRRRQADGDAVEVLRLNMVLLLKWHKIVLLEWGGSNRHPSETIN